SEKERGKVEKSCQRGHEETNRQLATRTNERQRQTTPDKDQAEYDREAQRCERATCQAQGCCCWCDQQGQHQQRANNQHSLSSSNGQQHQEKHRKQTHRDTARSSHLWID